MANYPVSKKRNTGISVEEKNDGIGQTLFLRRRLFFFSVVVRSHLFDIRVMRVCLKAREKSATYLIKIETACVGETKIICFQSESFFVLFVYFNVFVIRFAWRYFAEVCNELQGVFWRHGF